MPLTPRPTPPTAARVVIVDADRRVQQSVADLLSLTGEIRVVGRAGDVRAALEVVERERPDAVLVDPRLPDVEAGIAFVTGVARAWPATRIVLTGWGDTDGHALAGDPVTRYVSKSATPEEFVDALVDACNCR